MEWFLSEYLFKLYEIKYSRFEFLRSKCSAWNIVHSICINVLAVSYVKSVDVSQISAVKNVNVGAEKYSKIRNSPF